MSRILILLVPLIVVGAGGLVAFNSFSDDFSEITDTFSEGVDGVGVPDLPDLPDLTTPTAAVLTEDGYREMLSALEGRTGSTQVFGAVLYPEYASFEVPEDGTSLRSRRLSWNGELTDDNQLGTSNQQRVDLARLKPEVFLRLIRRVKALVDDPNTYYVIVDGKSTVFPDDGTRVRAYANNVYSEGAYIAADLTGKVIRKVTYWPSTSSLPDVRRLEQVAARGHQVDIAVGAEARDARHQSGEPIVELGVVAAAAVERVHVLDAGAREELLDQGGDRGERRA